MSGNLSFGDLKSHVEIGEIDTILACIVDMPVSYTHLTLPTKA